MPESPDVNRRRINWTLNLETCKLVETYTAKHGGDVRFNADFLIRRGAAAVGHFLTPEDYREIAQEIEENRAERERRKAERKANKKKRGE